MSFFLWWKHGWGRYFGPRRAAVRAKPTDEATIRRAFDESAANEEHFPSVIDPRILHVRRVIDAFAPLASGMILDAGSGKGRYARRLVEQAPQLTALCLDLSQAMLLHVEEPLRRCQGSLHDLPLATASVDGVYAIESLEHVPDPEHSVAELCRVAKPGATIIVIDKNAEQWGRLETPSWERWFYREEMAGWLRQHCREVAVEPLSYWEDVAPDGLFFLWRATK